MHPGGVPLEEYRRKRDERTTPEPFGGRAGGEPVFVVQRHAARSLHYDFRLERDGVLASWAVPKGVPLEPGSRALAVHVEDHPLDYAGFAGEIPEGQYGAGTVEIWDSGTYELLEEHSDGRLTVSLHGSRLNGSWSLVPAGLDGKEQNWLLIKRRDDPDDGRGLNGAEAAAAVSYEPMLATPVDRLPRGDWIYEAKLDGYRALAYLRGGECVLRSRNGNDLTARFAAVAKAVVQAARTPNAVLDGEVCRLDELGRTSFSGLQQGTGPLVYYAFDLLELDGLPLIDRPLRERRKLLGETLDRRSRTVRLSEDFDDGEALLAAVAERGLEGVVAKRGTSPYRPGRRSPDWVKLKVGRRQELVVVGYTRGRGRREDTFGSLVLAVVDDGTLRFAGNVGTGFREREIARLLDLLRPLHRESSPLAEVPRMPRVRTADVQWVEPVLVAEVAFSEWTHDGRVRHPSYQGLRDDKASGDVVREEPAPAPSGGRREVVRHGRREVRLSNLDKLFWAGDGITKGDLLEYYEAVAPVLVPHLKNRPFTMRRYPDGADGKAFFQKDAPGHMPAWIRTYEAVVSTRERTRVTKRVRFPLVDDELALLWMANMGCIDMNAWTSRIDRPDRPDYVLFDLDPTPEVPWRQTIEVALILRQLLEGLGLASFPKTSGGKGFHVLVPLDRRSTHADARQFAELVGGAIARTYPGLATTEWSKARRRGVLIDANQNGEGKTIASAYSVRPKPGAPVSTPLAWDEVDDRVDPAAFTMPVVLDRVGRLGDLHATLSTTRQSLSKAIASL